ncbi:syntaxin-8-like isoform X1 [Amphibalanus amphitrite]|uniref:syntaxin-8-like isoform X1 n=1 Tax=Amphibalanus amphitrite TaxID=1232801 RepID=UPI001C90FC62|nr:syntaxin-8-like isoform X1 [Amphibalanus amphitrite]XP_043200142.1 syntaxin-8-like isoform X1 [Amphibalanus amphitrite]
MAVPGGRVGVPGGLQDLGTIDWGGNDVPEQPTSTEGLRQQQRQLIREQDEGLDVLASVISRQRQMAGAIGAEIEEQSALIDDISDLAERGAARIEHQTRQVRRVDRKESGTCWYWVVIIALMIAIVVIFLW